MRKLIITAIVVAIGAAIVVVPIAASGNSKPEPTFDKALKKAKGPKDKLPGLKGKMAQLVPDPGAARYVGELAGHDVYIAPGADDTTCFIDTNPAADPNYVGYACIEQDSLQRQASYAAFGGSGGVNVIVPVADAYDTADVAVGGKRVKVKAKDNVALIEAMPTEGGTVTVTGEDVDPLEGEVQFGDG